MLSELYTLFVFCLTGLLIGCVFDLFRILRKDFKTPDFVTYIQDVLFWILSGLIIIYVIYNFSDGEIRLYMILIIMIGIVFYFLTISKLIMGINLKILHFFKKFSKK